MPYTVTPGSIMEFTIRGSANGQTTLSIFHFRYTGSGDYSNAQNATQAFINAYLPGGDGPITQDTWLNMMSQQWVQQGITAQWIYPLRYARQEELTPATVGAVAQNMLPQNVALAITKKSDLAGRIGTGTLHLPGVPVTFVTNGMVTAAALAAISPFVDQLNQAYIYSTREFVPIILHRAAGNLSQVIVNAQLQDTARTMRRRTVRLGI